MAVNSAPIIKKYLEEYQQEITLLKGQQALKAQELIELNTIIFAIETGMNNAPKLNNFVRDILQPYYSKQEVLDRENENLKDQIANKDWVVACLKAYNA